MAYIPSAETLTFDQYSTLAHETSFVEQLPSPDEHLFYKFMEETLEVLYEGPHAEWMLFLNGFITGTDEARQGIAKELGDNLWYINELALRSQQSLGDLAASAAFRHAGAPAPTTFREFDILAHEAGQNYFVVNHKMQGNRDYSGDEALRRLIETNVADNTGYVLQRVLSRLVRHAGRNYTPLSGPWANADFDDDLLWTQSPEDALWVFSTTATNNLNTSLADVAVGNLVKLQRRQQAGTLEAGEDADRS